MIRAILLVALSGLLLLVLYLPSAYPPERFLSQVLSEDAAIKALWNDERAHRILARALQMALPHERTLIGANRAPLTPAPSPGTPAAELEAASQRLLANDYVRSTEALVVLAAYRLSTLLQWAPWLVAIWVALIADGLIVRAIKAREFRQHDPEVFAVWAGIGCCVVIAMVVAWVLPWELHPLAGPAAVLSLGLALGTAVRSFHRR